MRTLVTTILISTFYNLAYAQRKVTGNYHDYFGNKIELKQDSTFRHTWNFDLASSWTIGKWTIKNDTIIFQVRPVFDTLMYFDENLKIQIDTLVLSLDQSSNRINKEEYIIGQVASDRQDTLKMAKKIFYRNEKLYDIDQNGKLIKKKLRGFWTKRKYVPWYVKE